MDKTLKITFFRPLTEGSKAFPLDYLVELDVRFDRDDKLKIEILDIVDLHHDISRDLSFLTNFEVDEIYEMARIRSEKEGWLDDYHEKIKAKMNEQDINTDREYGDDE